MQTAKKQAEVFMSNLIITNDGKQYKSVNGFNGSIGIIAGLTGSTVLSTQLKKHTLKPVCIKMTKLYKSVPFSEIGYPAIEKAKKIAQLDKKGVKIVNAADINYDEYLKNLNMIELNTMNKSICNRLLSLNGTDIEGFKKLPFKNQFKLLKEIMKKHFQAVHIKHVIKGNVSSYMETKTVVTNFNNRGLALTHEIGHAIHHNSKGLWKNIMIKYKKNVPLLSAIFLTAALIKRKKADGEGYKNKFDKATTFVKNNIGLISTGLYVPTIAEEIHASVLGNRIAKQIYSPELYKKTVKITKFGALTYIITGIISGLSAWTAVKIKDLIAKPKLIKNSDK